MSVVVFGSLNMDLTTYVSHLPRPGETLLGHSYLTAPGGKGANQAVAAARLGAPTRLVGRVGDDAFGRDVLSLVAAQGVNVAAVAIDANQATGLAVINVDEQAENTIIVISGANMALDDSDVVRAALDEAAVLLLQGEVPLSASLALARRARQGGVTVIYDPAPARPLPPDALALFDIITPNEVEAEALLGFRPTNPEEAATAAATLRARGVATAVIKLGAQGVYYESPERRDFVPAFPVKAVDTVAAGDAFNGGLAVALAEGHEIAEALRWSAAAGAIAVTRPGAMPAMPYRNELERLLTKGQLP